MPPTRFRVVERGRRLEVIDTERPATTTLTRPADTSADSKPGWWPRPTRFDGTVAWTTLPFYDAKAPRTIELDPGRAVLARVIPAALVIMLIALAVVIAFAPWALAALFALVNPKVRANARNATTRMIDRLEQ